MSRFVVPAAALLALGALGACGRAYDARESPPLVADEAGSADASDDVPIGARSDGSIVDGGVVDSSDAAVLSPDRPRIFITSTQYSGALGGLLGADARCAGIAKGKGLSGVYKAWLSSTFVGAFGRISGTGPWYRMDGAVVFLSRAALLVGPAVSISADENGSIAAGVDAWTGTSVSGDATSATCADWSTSTSEVGTVGDPASTGPHWTDTTAPSQCNLLRRLICLRAD